MKYRIIQKRLKVVTHISWKTSNSQVMYTITCNATVTCSIFLIASIKTEKSQLILNFHNFQQLCFNLLCFRLYYWSTYYPWQKCTHHHRKRKCRDWIKCSGPWDNHCPQHLLTTQLGQAPPKVTQSTITEVFSSRWKYKADSPKRGPKERRSPSALDVPVYLPIQSRMRISLLWWRPSIRGWPYPRKQKWTT